MSTPGFTLIEIMVAVSIVAMFMTVAMPSLFRSMNENSMRYAAEKVLECCRDARARAILDGKPMDLRISNKDRSFTVAPAALRAPALGDAGGFGFDGGQLQPREEYQWDDRMRPHAGGGAAGGTSSFKLGPNIVMDQLWVTGDERTGDEACRVRFYPNGTSDKMVLVLRSLSDAHDGRTITLEEVTGLAEMEGLH
jgi:prepilin-type N-terminal cleavage/methylation domain-containing protein